MTKKEIKKKALAAYPISGSVVETHFGRFKIDNNTPRREGYIKGYQDAEKDVLKDARWIEIYDDTTWEMVDDFIHRNIDGAYRVIIVKK